MFYRTTIRKSVETPYFTHKEGKQICVLFFALFAVLALLFPRRADAQQTGSSSTQNTGSDPMRSIAVMPWHFSGGAKNSPKYANDFLNRLLEKNNITRSSDLASNDTSQSANNSNHESSDSQLPTTAEMIRTGRDAKCRWVMAGSLRWHTRCIWVGWGLKTKSNAYVTIRIIDLTDNHVVLNAKDVQANDNGKDILWKHIVLLLFGGLISSTNWFSGGPRTPHERQSADLAIATAMKPWLLSDTNGKSNNPVGN